MTINFDLIPSPCFLLDEKLFRKNLETLKFIEQESAITLILAFKGFAMWPVFSIYKEFFDCAAASSLNEARLCYEQMGEPAHTYSPAYKNEEFPDIINFSKYISFNSLKQYEEFYPFIKAFKPDCETGLRVNPEYSDVKTDIYNPAQPGSRLGVAAAQMPEKLPEGISGLHFHTLCESDSYSLEKTLDVFEKKFGHLLNQVKWINMGGGHLITHEKYNHHHLIKLLKNFKSKHHVDIILEPGAAFAWNAGYLVSTVLDIVENNGIQTAMLDVSFTAHMPDTLEMPYKPNILGALNEVSGKHLYRMGGNSCLSGDYKGNWSFDNPLAPGDKILFEDMMHYTMVKTTHFNGVPHPSIGMWTIDNEFKLFRKYDYEDYKSSLS